MKSTKNLIFGLFFTILFAINISFAWTYPVLNITGKFCGNSNPECTIPLPHIENANYLKYQNSTLHRRIYSVLWGGTYFGGRDFGLGSHKGVDISSKAGTPIVAMGSGVVIFAGQKGDRGNLITIKHQIASHNIYSSYAHLQEIFVVEGEHVTEGKMIAKMGNTGNSTGPHLHFQIDTNEGKHPYHPGNCGGETLNQNVNEARCWNLVKQNTLDPILFLETNGAIFEAENIISPEKNHKNLILDSKNLAFNLDYPIRKEGQYFVLNISSDSQGNEGFLAQELEISGSGLSISPARISYIKNSRKVFITTDSPGLKLLNISQGGKIIKSLQIRSLDETTFQKIVEKAKTNTKLAEILKKILN